MTILVTIQTQLIVEEASVIKSWAPKGVLAAAFENDRKTCFLRHLRSHTE